MEARILASIVEGIANINAQIASIAGEVTPENGVDIEGQDHDHSDWTSEVDVIDATRALTVEANLDETLLDAKFMAAVAVVLDSRACERFFPMPAERLAIALCIRL